MKPIEKTCKCIKDFEFDNHKFIKNREYQIDLYPLFYKIYRNGGWDDYIFLSEEDIFCEYFKIID